MIIEIPNENSIIKWKNTDKDEWKVAEIYDLIKAYERPEGEWVFKDLHNGKTWYECSICGRKIHVRDKAELSDFPFCHCGAELKEKKND